MPRRLRPGTGYCPDLDLFGQQPGDGFRGLRGRPLACGSKTNNGTLGLDPRGGRLQSVIEWAVAEGMPAGIAVKCHLQHATPAAFYAHVPDRGDEKAITRDLLASNIDVLIGAGRRLEKESSEGGSYRDAFGRRGYAVAGSLEEAEPVRAGRLLCAVTDENIPKTIRREDYLRCATQKALEILSHNADSGRPRFCADGRRVTY